MPKINYTDKQTPINPASPASNEIFTAADANEIKNVVNAKSDVKTIVFTDFESDLKTVNNSLIKTIKALTIRGIGPLIPVTDYTTLPSGGFTILYPGFEASADTAISIHYTEI